MDLEDDAIPPPIRRFPQSSSRGRQLILEDDDDDDWDEAAPPPIARQRSASQGHKRKPSIPPKSPLRPSTSPLSRSNRNFSYPSRSPAPKTEPDPSSRPKAKPIADRKSTQRAKFPPTIRRWSSLETIDSIPTVHEPTLDERNLRNSFTSTPDSDDFYQDEDDDHSYATPSLTDSTSTESGSRPASGFRWVNQERLQNRSASSLLQRLKRGKAPEPVLDPDHLQIQRTIAVDQTSERASSSSSISTISTHRPSDLGRNPEWRASNFDVSQLSEAELKKCKKKGINPALYAEMKAARKGKWVGALTGNTIL